jgi:ribonuclease R
MVDRIARPSVYIRDSCRTIQRRLTPLPRPVKVHEPVLPKRSKSAARTLPFPRERTLLAYIADASGKVGKREIARAFNIQGGDRIWLKQT